MCSEPWESNGYTEANPDPTCVLSNKQGNKIGPGVVSQMPWPRKTWSQRCEHSEDFENNGLALLPAKWHPCTQ